MCELWDPATPWTSEVQTTVREHPPNFIAWMGADIQYYPLIMAIPKGES